MAWNPSSSFFFFCIFLFSSNFSITYQQFFLMYFMLLFLSPMKPQTLKYRESAEKHFIFP